MIHVCKVSKHPFRRFAHRVSVAERRLPKGRLAIGLRRFVFFIDGLQNFDVTVSVLIAREAEEL
ncbi:MAG: hypothetical protein KTR25_20005 [Myxococcales bacterium]|nr:hypothetical protein [Myxococcales bacterium]